MHGATVVRLVCRRILHHACHVGMMMRDTRGIVACPACRGPADVIAEFRFIGIDRAPVAGARRGDQAAEELDIDFGLFREQSPRPVGGNASDGARAPGQYDATPMQDGAARPPPLEIAGQGMGYNDRPAVHSRMHRAGPLLTASTSASTTRCHRRFPGGRRAAAAPTPVA